MNKKTLLIFAATLLAPIIAHAGCEANMQTWMNTLHADRTLDTQLAVCSVWKAHPDLTLAALPMQQARDGAADGAIDLDMVVANSVSGEIVAHLYQPNAITYDKRHAVDMAFDMTQYPIVTKGQSFGLRASFEHAPQEQPKGGIALNLYVLDGQSLTQVLDRFPVSLAQGKWDGKCAGYFDATSRNIETGSPGASGFAALKITQTTARTVTQSVRGQCVSKEGSPRRDTFTIDFRDGMYVVPSGMRRG
jgi:hypothetical protein